MATKDDSTQHTTVRNADESTSKEDICIEGSPSSEGGSQEDTSGQCVRDNRDSSAPPESAVHIRAQLAEHVGTLRFVNSVMMVCIQALLQQAADLDEEIALVLQRTAGDKLDETIERIEAIAFGLEFEGGEA